MNGNKDKYKTRSLRVLSRSPFSLLNPPSLQFLAWIPAGSPSGPGVLAVNLLSPTITSVLVRNQKLWWSCLEAVGDPLFSINCWTQLSLNTTIYSLSLPVSTWPLTSHSSWTCAPWHSYLLAKCYTRHKHTLHRWSAVCCWLSRKRWNRI